MKPDPEIDLPDFRIVTVSVDANDVEGVSDVHIDTDGTGYYEALGMLVAAVVSMARPILDEDEDESEDDE
ncbi:hypothetical protein UFOVP1305_31 [uncultured Caudovirales phage]|uniref:Uncharacterized protein n=1 Tax=uncultured Caudovirales phage TaxID=2100421 RepID=A0A6J5PF27_9CAUD|nr:hypothetical protein UFOVP896_69 [uncultured Caudovirales phage]CAB4197749.1 hypothetical protein UFOVP1305_31 [uncultured Caudovirales phage]